MNEKYQLIKNIYRPSFWYYIIHSYPAIGTAREKSFFKLKEHCDRYLAQTHGADSSDQPDTTTGNIVNAEPQDLSFTTPKNGNAMFAEDSHCRKASSTSSCLFNTKTSPVEKGSSPVQNLGLNHSRHSLNSSGSSTESRSPFATPSGRGSVGATRQESYKPFSWLRWSSRRSWCYYWHHFYYRVTSTNTTQILLIQQAET